MAKETVEARAVEIAARVIQADGLCRYDSVGKCTRHYEGAMKGNGEK